MILSWGSHGRGDFIPAWERKTGRGKEVRMIEESPGQKEPLLCPTEEE